MPGAAVQWQMAIPPISWPRRARLLLGLSLATHLLPSCSQTPWRQPPFIRPTQACLAPPHGRCCSHLPLLLPLPREREPGHGAAGQLHLPPPTPLLPRPSCSPVTHQHSGQPRLSCHNLPLPCLCSASCFRQARPSHPVPGFNCPDHMRLPFKPPPLWMASVKRILTRSLRCML